MRLNILLDYLISHIARACRKVPSRPQMASPELATQFTKFLQHFSTTGPFQLLHQLTDCYVGWHRHQQMHVIFGYMPTQHIHIQFRTLHPHQLSQSFSNLAPQHWLAIFGDPDHMIFDVVHRMRCFSIAAHSRILRRSYLFQPVVKTAHLKVGVFHPIYRQ